MMEDCTEGMPYLDAADRLQRNLDVQVETIAGIEEKAEHVTRVLGMLMGLILSSVSLGFQFGGMPSLSTQTVAAFSMGIGALVVSMAVAMVTYLNSRFKVGLDSTAGYLLANPEFETDTVTHARRLLGVFAHSIEVNERVIAVNSSRFRLALVLLIVGIVYLALSLVLFVSEGGPLDGWLGVPVAGLLATAVGWYVLSGRYLTIREERWT